MTINLPISKSIANRLLMLQHMHGDELMPVSAAMPEDVRLLHAALRYIGSCHPGNAITIDCRNAGTVIRFLTACVAGIDGLQVCLTGCTRMTERPIGDLVDALRQVGAHITYLGQQGFPPLLIHGKILQRHGIIEMPRTLSSQFVSAMLLSGWQVKTDDDSPYIAMTRHVIAAYPRVGIERDWSAAAFWYEWVAIHGGVVDMPGLKVDSMQGDRVVTEVFKPLGVETDFRHNSVRIRRMDELIHYPATMEQDFTHCPDLYPAVYVTCLRLGINMSAKGTQSLTIKESNRLAALASIPPQPDNTIHKNQHDHRIAMALLAGGYTTDDAACITKSYPMFIRQLMRVKTSMS